MVGMSRYSTVPSEIDSRWLVSLTCAAPPMWNGPHRQLGARLADRLRRDHADRLADVDRGAAREVTPVARAADALLGLADQRAADLGRLDFGFLDRLDHRLVEQRARLDDDFAGLGVDQVLGGGAAEDALAERGDHRAALDDRAHLERALGAAILLDDHAVLRHVDQAAGQVARVRRLERGVGEALARAVGRVEVLEDGQAFLEVRDDRGLDDLARRLGHQAAHAGELLHLRRRTARARVAHHVDRVGLLLRPSSSSFSPEISRIMSAATWSPQRLQASITLLYFSCWVMKPSWYCCS
jgi:hypothetical protein